MAGPKKRVTIKDVGAEAGVSWTTVSRVLTGSSFSERISPETKARIFAAAQKLGYKPSASGVALKRGYSNSVAVLIVNWDVATAHSRAVMRLTQVARARGLSATIHVGADDQEGKALLDTIRTMSPYGLVVIWDSGEVPVQELAELEADGIPCVDLMPSLPGGPLSITWDREQGFRIGVEHLAKLGHRKIALLRSIADGSRTSEVKLSGYRLGLADAGIDYDESLVQDVRGDEFMHGQEGFAGLIERHPDVTAVMCMDDPVAVGAIAAAREMGLAVPGDISVVGYGARAGWHLIPPKLTTIAAMATPVVQSIVDYLTAVRTNAEHVQDPISIPMVILVGKSTGPAPNVTRVRSRKLKLSKT